MQTLWHKLTSGKSLLFGGVGMLGISYPATVACNVMQVDFTAVLYGTVIAGTALILAGMARIFN